MSKPDCVAARPIATGILVRDVELPREQERPTHKPLAIPKPALPARRDPLLWFVTVVSMAWALVIMTKLVVRVGLFADYRRSFWRMAWPRLRAGRIEEMIHVGLVAHHMIVFARDCARGRENASMFAKRPKRAAEPALPVAT